MGPLEFTLNSRIVSLQIVSPSLRNQGICSSLDLGLLCLTTSFISVGQNCVGAQRILSDVIILGFNPYSITVYKPNDLSLTCLSSRICKMGTTVEHPHRVTVKLNELLQGKGMEECPAYG